MIHRQQTNSKIKNNKYSLYERAIQSPAEDVELYLKMFQKIAGKTSPEPRILREDFCGTFAFACAWVKISSSHHALALDLDPKPLAYGKKNHFSELSLSEKSRLRPLQKNVLSVTTPRADLVVAGNFSLFAIKDWYDLVEYFKNVRASMNSEGMFFLEIAGGPEFIEKGEDKRLVRSKDTGKFTYIWEQKSFDPISNEGKYAIHFRLESGKYLRNAFTYDWRIWSIPELRLALQQAGFSRSEVLWEKMIAGEGTNEYYPTKRAPNHEFWLSYVVGIY
jgi:hypothetical protein